jgi:hypothetical protein
MLLIATAVLALGLSRSASADVVTWASTLNGSFGTLDMTTGVYSQTGSTMTAGGDTLQIYGMGYIGNTLYGVDSSPAGAGFYSIATPSGLSTADSSSPLAFSAIGGTAAFGLFYGVSQDTPAAIWDAVPGFGIAASVPLSFSGDGLIVLNQSGTLAYIGEGTGTGVDELHAFNGFSSSDIGSLNHQAYTGILDGNMLYTTDGLNVYTYLVTPTSVTEIDGGSGIAITGLGTSGDLIGAVAAAVPEPSTMVMGALALAAGAIVYARRRYLTA